MIEHLHKCVYGILTCYAWLSTFQNTRNHDDETRRASSYHSYSQSPPYDYQYEELRYGKQAPALTKKPGSDRGMFCFMSTSRLSDHGQEDRFANEVPNARVSDFSVSSAGDPFRSDTQSPTCQRDFGFSSPKRDPDQVTNACIFLLLVLLEI
ncbi:hypothetical protein Ccrd_026871 [Cynara cardunculus var. scolymus]|uniref:Uncharacterized protein n=1 Tax=Cynara cardunculus var. scolymus TaxID=59895 RepID=A0A118F1P1_CYNCS|nr:hypothetical protein Ccrd_026871 [Cynara cardunculus var. scolymus]